MSYVRAFAHHTFSTKQFVPGHLLGATIIAVGTVALVRAFSARHAAEVRASREHALVDPARERGGNTRGQYGTRGMP